MEFQPQDPQRFETAWRRFDEENARDPNQEIVDGRPQPRELVYARWLSDWVVRLAPQASEALRLAARCQHLCRWMIPRGSYPMTRAGYLKWREDLKRFHAKRAGEILRELGYPEGMIRAVQNLNLKKELHDPDCQVLEDALCLVFLEHQLHELSEKASEEKLINALQKSWKKMTPRGQEFAKGLPLGAREKELLEKALPKRP